MGHGAKRPLKDDQPDARGLTADGRRWRGRMQSLAVAFSLALLLAGVTASTASAHAAKITIGCTSVTWTYEDFPNASNNTVEQTVEVGTIVSKTKFSFNGPSGEDTTAISVPSGQETKVAASASWETNGVSGSSQEERSVKCGFTIEKLQKLFGGAGSFTTSKLMGKVGETVDYEIIVTNVGESSLSFANFTDTGCEGISGGPSGPLAPGESSIYTCEHMLTSASSEACPSYHLNNATVTGTSSESEFTETSNTVEACAEPPAGSPPEFTIKKTQKLEGGTAYTTSQLMGMPGQTVDYEIVVTNTGTIGLTFNPLNDAGCTNISPSGSVTLAPGGEQTYTCEHMLTGASDEACPSYHLNTAAVGTTSGGVPVEKPSNTVEACATAPSQPAASNVAASAPQQAVKAVCSVSEPSLTLHGATGPKRVKFTVHIGSLGIKKITFYLDGRKLKTLNASQAKNGVFSLTINPRKLSYGAHRVSVKTVMSSSACANIARSAVFVHAHAGAVSPEFTG
jgi:uncharacterized repeat protein (TIGR01451 family)